MNVFEGAAHVFAVDLAPKRVGRRCRCVCFGTVDFHFGSNAFEGGAHFLAVDLEPERMDIRSSGFKSESLCVNLMF